MITTIVLIRVDPTLIPTAANMLAGVEGVVDSAVEPELRPAEHRECTAIIHGAPGEVDEPFVGTPLDVRP